MAQDLATADHHHNPARYVAALHALARRCHSTGPKPLAATVSTAYRALGRNGLDGASYLSVLDSLTARTDPKGPPGSCRHAVTAYVAEVSGARTSSHPYAGYAATVDAWAAAHRADPAHADSYLPRLPNGQDSYEVFGAGRVTTLIRYFDPPLAEPVALSLIARTLLPRGRLHPVYNLRTPNCLEQIYLNRTLGGLLGSSSLGVQVELTSGHGVTSRYHPALVTRARLTTGGRIGGQECV